MMPLVWAAMSAYKFNPAASIDYHRNVNIELTTPDYKKWMNMKMYDTDVHQ